MTERLAWAYGLIILTIIILAGLEWRRRTVRNRSAFEKYRTRSDR